MSAASMFTAKKSGVYRAPGSVGVLRANAEKAGCAWLEIAVADVADKAQFFAACKKGLKLPAHFGSNWDALADCLRDHDALKAHGGVVHLIGAAQFAKAAPSDHQTALDVFNHAAEFWKGRDKPFVVLVDGASKIGRAHV